MSIASAGRESLVYRSAVGYATALRLLYGRYYSARLQSVAALVPEGASVLELCCGPGTLYFDHLHPRGIHYMGLDASPRFVARLRRRGADALVRDLRLPEPLPGADYVVMQASLYQFLPDARPVVDRMLTAARSAVIVSEPIRNLATSGVRPLAWIARRSASTAGEAHARRFDEESLDALMVGYGQAIRHTELIPGGREKIYVLDAVA